MSPIRPTTPREKAILWITVTLGVLFVLYYIVFTPLMDRYAESNAKLDKARTDYEKAKLTLQDSAQVEREYKEIAKRLPKVVTGKRPEMVFTEEIAALCRTIGLPSTVDILPTTSQKIPDASGYSYLILKVEKITGPLPKLVEMLQQLSARNYLIRSLIIEASPTGREEEMQMEVEVAEIMRTEDLTPGEPQGPTGENSAAESDKSANSEEEENL